jgi:hypothetical protein
MKKVVLVVVFVILIIWICATLTRSELFGESIYTDASGGEPPRESPNIFTSGATMRVIGQTFTATDQR